MLVNLGLSHRDETVYRAMLAHPALGVRQLAEYLEMPQEEVRSALDVLADLALIRANADGFRTIRPQAGLMSLLAQAEADIAARQRQLEATRAAVASIAEVYEDRVDREVAVHLEGVDAVRDRLAELARTARRECLSFTTGAAQAPDTLAGEKPLNELAIERGVQIRNMYQDSFRNDPATLAHARRMAELGSRSRTVPTLPMRLVVVDRETALVPADPADSRAGALEVRNLALVASLVALFEQVWASGTPFGEAPARDVNGLVPLERDLLKLLASGHTDESAARKLSMSVRSVQRMMTGLTERLDTASRFQAGVEATRRGWV
ncbi:helix-turn-helix domain-containing protein [Catellatospora vulcania]|uniref:LuxR family transcriptional regulator n=1 Tax=Catellatospora vulcania TaxID=1460450 RepID=UPI0012D4A600|nr:LuxR family transcriptional regulator [Catellatospora vulcania]